jgi:hypothetical protein
MIVPPASFLGLVVEKNLKFKLKCLFLRPGAM